jgi:hypothetical protein
MSICSARPTRPEAESDMTPEERQMLANLFERINATSSTPRDSQAEAFINDAVRAAPFAPYVLAQTVLVQQRALEAAAQRVAELEAAARQATDPHQEQGSFLGNLGRSIFGGPSPSAPPPPRPSYDAPSQRGAGPAPGYAPPPQSPPYGAPQPGPWSAPAGGGGGGFLQNAASTAAGVAGGVALGNLLGGLFSGHSGGGLFGGGSSAGFFGGGQPGGNETVNIFESAPDRDDQGQFDPNMPDDAGFLDDSSFDDNSGGGLDDV